MYKGMFVKGFTYNQGDFFDKGTTRQGCPKLRNGVVVDICSNKYIKVQFENNSAKKLNKKHFSNSINIYDAATGKIIRNIKGTDSYCIWIRKNTLYEYYNYETKANIDNASINRKQSLEKSKVEKKYFSSKNKLNGLTKKFIDTILKTSQFSKEEIQLTIERANEKVECIKNNHLNQNSPCNSKELKKLTYLEINYKEDPKWIFKDLPDKVDDNMKFEMIAELIIDDFKKEFISKKKINIYDNIIKYSKQANYEEQKIKKIIDQIWNDIFKMAT